MVEINKASIPLKKRNKICNRRVRRITKASLPLKKRNNICNRRVRRITKGLTWLGSKPWMRIAILKRKPKHRAPMKLDRKVNVVEFLRSFWLGGVEGLNLGAGINVPISEPKDVVDAKIAWRIKAKSVMKAVEDLKKYIEEVTAWVFLLENCLETLKDPETIQEAHTYFCLFPFAHEKVISSVAELENFDNGQDFRIICDERAPPHEIDGIMAYCKNRAIEVQSFDGFYPQQLL